VYLDVIFGVYCVVIAAAATVGWWNGYGTLRTVVSLFAFCVTNGIISQISRRAVKPAPVEFARLLVGSIIAGLAYVTTEAPFGMWWAGFLIQALGGAVFFGLLTGSAVPGRLIAISCAALLCVTEYLANPHPNWYAILVVAGVMIMVACLLAEIVAMLERALNSEREQKEALRLEKQRSEQLCEREADAALRAGEARIRMEMDRALRAIVEGTAGSIGTDFLVSLVEHLAGALGVDHAFVAEVIDRPRTRVRTTAFWSLGRAVPNIEYDLAGTPCEHVVAGGMCYHRDGVRQAFPDDRDLVTLGAESYLGMPLHDTGGQVLGHVAVLDNHPMQDEERRREILRIFAARAGAELERQRSERALMTLNRELESRVSDRTAELQSALDDRSRLAAVIESTTDLVGMAGMDGRILYLNRAGRERLGVGLDENVRSYDLSTFYTPASLDLMLREGIPTAVTRGAWSGELVMVNRRGDQIPVWLSGTAHVGPDGSPRFLSCLARDISERKRVEQELQSAKDAAEAASRAKSTFLATMSHEIRTPMNAVIGMTDLLLTTALSPKQREFVETIRGSGDTLLTVINDILDFSKIEAGRLELERRAFDVRAALESTLDLLAPRAAQKGLELALSFDPSLPSLVVGDETRLRQVIINLAGNGLKFTDRGEVVVSVSARALGPADVELVFAVRDTGIGVPPDKRDRLFTSFGQLDPSTTREYGGTGLGLAITKRLVELMGGTIWVESEGVPGRGSAFQFTIRVNRGTADERLVRHGGQPALAGRRALVVDDNATNRRILGLQLQGWGMLAVEAALPSEALDVLRRGDRFDVVLLDMQMPGMDGVSLAKAICAQRGSRRLPIVMLTSLGHDLGAEAEAVACFAGCLTKPVKPSQLHDTIVAALVGRDTRSPGDIRSAPPGKMPSQPRPAPGLDILLAEDMEVNRRFALLALEELGYHAHVASNGLEVLQALARQRYTVVLMDVQMPDMDGLEATRRIRREWPTDRQPHIIAMTANAMQGDREICLEAGMDDYLSKPVYLEELRLVLERAAARIATWSTAASGPATAAAIDRATLDRLLARPEGDDLVKLFVTEADETMRQLQQAVLDGDLRHAQDAAHRLKGSSGYVGATRIAALSAELESATRSGHAAQPTVLEALQEEMSRVQQLLMRSLGI
jgi:PAS domain S-box-containing protein